MNSQNPSSSVSSPLDDYRTEIPVISAAIKGPMPLFISGICAIWAGHAFHQSAPITFAATLFAYLLALLSVIDLKHGILPHILTGTLITLGTVLAPTLGMTYWDSALGAFIAFAGLGAMALLTAFLTGKAALGGGDLYLVCGLGAWLGVSGLPMLLVATALTGTLSIVIKRWLTRGLPTYQALGVAQSTFPFGPALCAAGWLAFLYAPLYWQCIEMLISPAH